MHPLASMVALCVTATPSLPLWQETSVAQHVDEPVATARRSNSMGGGRPVLLVPKPDGKIVSLGKAASIAG